MYYIRFSCNWDRTSTQVELTKDIPYLALKGELWDVFFKDFGENWLRYNTVWLYYSQTYCVQKYSHFMVFCYVFVLSVLPIYSHQEIDCFFIGTKPLRQPMITYHQTSISHTKSPNFIVSHLVLQ